MSAAQPPVVWIIDPDHWPRACIRAELIERGYDAVGYETLQTALIARRRSPRRRPVAIVIEERGFQATPMDRASLLRLQVPLLGLSGGEGPVEAAWQGFPFAAVLRRPFTVGEIADAVEKIAGRPVSSGSTSPPGS